MSRLVSDAGVGDAWRIDSAGTLGLHAGDLPDARMRAAARRRGYVLESRARQVRREDFSRFDLILAMDRQNRSDLEQLGGGTVDGGRLALFGEFCVRHEIADVPDPYYGGPEGFERVLDLLEDGCSELLRRWKEDGGAWRE
jgi:protein-tyrosine phosphatase